MRRSADVRAMWKAIAAQPLEDTPKLALADLYDELGEPRMGYALRWCVAHGKWPELSEDWVAYRGRRPAWRYHWRLQRGRPSQCTLDKNLLGLVTGGWWNVDHWPFATCEAAVRALARAQEKLRRVIEVPS